MTILCSLSLQWPLKKYYELPEDTIIYVPNLSFNGGTRLIKEAIADPEIKIYKGDARRKTEKQKWLQHLTVGAINPSVFQIKLSNGVKILDYSKFDPTPVEELTEEKMQPLANLLAIEYGAPITPSAIIKAQVPLLNAVQGKNRFGSVMPGSELSEPQRAYGHQALFGGAVYNMRRNGAYKLIDNETHVDYHQMYAHIMKNYPFPDISSGYIVTPGYEPHPLAVYHICGGRIKLKKDGFPLIALERGADDDRESYFADWHEIPWQYLTEPDLQTLMNNFLIDPEQPLEIDETFRYNRSVDGALIFGKFIDDIYKKRMNSEGSIKKFYKMLNEYLPGSFERRQEDGRFWIDLSGPQPGKATQYNSIIGAFITAYGRQLLNSLLHAFPYNKVIGYDTDCVFFHGTPDQVPEKVRSRFGDGVGQLHFDGIYTNVRHLSPKQYYGLDEGKAFGKFSAVPHGDEVAATLISYEDDLAKAPVTQVMYMWDDKEQEYVQELIPARLSVENFKRDVEPIKKIRGIWQI